MQVLTSLVRGLLPLVPGRSARVCCVFCLVAILAACTAARAPTPSPLATPLPTASPAPILASITPSASTAPTATPTSIPFTVPTTLTPGPWRSILWTRVEGTGLPEETNGWDVLGWSKGFLAMDTAEEDLPDGTQTWRLHTSYSADGLVWKRGQDIPVPVNAADFGFQGFATIVEGPAGLLAMSVERTTCSYPGTYLFPIAISHDGASWEPLDPNSLHGGVQTISGGTSGYIATSALGAAFTSADGIHWKAVDLRARAFAGLDEVSSGVAFQHGFVISGNAHGPATEGCAAWYTLLKPAIWFSPDAKTWTRVTVPGAVSGSDVTMFVCRMSDRVLVAREWPGTSTWGSRDGLHWKLVDLPGADACGVNGFDGSQTRPGSGQAAPLSNGNEVLIDTSDESGVPRLYSIADDLTLRELAQVGDTIHWSIADGPYFGPAYLIAFEGGHTFVGVLQP